MTQSSTRGDIYPISPRVYFYLFVIFVFWIAFPRLANENFDKYVDMFENYVWGIRWQWGNSNHPPLFGWTVAAWFEIFPRTRVSYWALASLNLTASLALMVCIARRFLNERQQECALMLALIVPLLSFQAIRYNANSAMLPYWAALILIYMRLYERPKARDAVLLGGVAVLAMLSKYYSATIIVALFIHAMTSARMRSVVFSRMGLLATLVFVIGLVPHINWLFANDFRPLRFAASEQGASDVAHILYSQADFFLGQIVYLLPGLLILIVYHKWREGLTGFNLSHVSEFYKDPKPRILIYAFAGSAVVAMALSLAVWSPLTSNWSLPAHIVAPILLVSLLPVSWVERRPLNAPILVGVFCTIALALAPFVHTSKLKGAKGTSAVPFRQIAAQVDKIWQMETSGKIRALGGDRIAIYGTAFYSKDRPQVLPRPKLSKSPWVQARAFSSESLLLICPKQSCAARWRAQGWQLRKLPSMRIPALDGAGGPDHYDYFLWAGKIG